MEHSLTGSQLVLLSQLVRKEYTNNNLHYALGADHPDQIELKRMLNEIRSMTSERFEWEDEQRRCEHV